jgi:hypothetical protein
MKFYIFIIIGSNPNITRYGKPVDINEQKYRNIAESSLK